VAEVSFSKQGVADLGDIEGLEVALEFSQTSKGGLFGKALNRLKPADPDLTAIAFAGSMAVDAVDPKNKQSIYNGAVVHQGDAKGDGSEVIRFDLGRIGEEDKDITAFGLVAACSDGFGRVEGATARFYDTSGGGRKHLGNVRFSVTGNHTGALLGVFQQSESGGWQFRKEAVYGQGKTWRDYARMAEGRVQ
jgi:hypothetical protein